MTLDQDNQAAPAPLTKKKKVVKFKEDAALELTDEEMRAAKRDYVSEMARQKEQQRLLEKQRTDVALAQQMIFGTPKDSMSPSSLGAMIWRKDDHLLGDFVWAPRFPSSV